MAQAAYPILPILVGYPIQAQPQVQQPTQFATNKHVLPLQTICQMKIARLAKEQIEQNERNEQLAREQITERPRKVLVGGKARAINNVADFAQKEQLPLQVATIAGQNSANTSGPSNQVELGHSLNGISIGGKSLFESIPDQLIERIEKSYHVLRSENNFKYAKDHLYKYEKNFFSDDPIVNSIIIGDDIACKALLADKKIVDNKYLRYLVTTAMMAGQSNIIHLLMSYIPENERAAFVTSKDEYGETFLMLPIYVLIDYTKNEYGAYEIIKDDRFFLQRRTSYPHCKINSAVIRAILSYIPENERVDFIKNHNLGNIELPLQFFTRDGLKTLLSYIPENEREDFVTVGDSHPDSGQKVFPFEIYEDSEITEEDLENMLEVIDELINCIPENKREILIRDSIRTFDVNNPISLKIVQKFLSYIPEDKREDLVLSNNPNGKSIIWYFTVCENFETINWLLDNVIKNINRINIYEFLNNTPEDCKDFPGLDNFIYLIKEMVKRNAQLGHLLTSYVIQSPDEEEPFFQFEILLHGGVSIDSKDFLGYTALMMAAKLDKLEKARFFIEHKANLDERDPTGSTALHFAAALGFVDITQALLAAGADASIRNNDGKTALDLAKDANMDETIRILTDHNAHK